MAHEKRLGGSVGELGLLHCLEGIKVYLPSPPDPASFDFKCKASRKAQDYIYIYVYTYTPDYTIVVSIFFSIILIQPFIYSLLGYMPFCIGGLFCSVPCICPNYRLNMLASHPEILNPKTFNPKPLKP